MDGELFHAYIISGAREDTKEHIEKMLAPFGLFKSGNSDYMVSEHVSYKIEDARDLISWQSLIPSGKRKVYVVYTDFITREAENALLKTLEEPIPNTHIIFSLPKPHMLLPTLLSRVRIISVAPAKNPTGFLAGHEAEKFLNLSKVDRIAYISKLIEKGDDEDAAAESREKALFFTDQLETYFEEKFTTDKSVSKQLEIILKIKKYLFLNGASIKILTEALALTI